MRKLRGYEIALCYGSAGFIGGAATVRFLTRHPNWGFPMGCGVSFVVLIVLISIIRLGD
jgi:uncharacterized membrane protein YsdA (DUF1294 family)